MLSIFSRACWPSVCLWASLVARGIESACQCRRWEFHPWVVKVLWGRKWLPTSVLLLGKSHRWGSMADYSPWGHKRVRHDSVINVNNNAVFFGDMSLVISCIKTWAKETMVALVGPPQGGPGRLTVHPTSQMGVLSSAGKGVLPRSPTLSAGWCSWPLPSTRRWTGRVRPMQLHSPRLLVPLQSLILVFKKEPSGCSWEGKCEHQDG